MYMQADLPALEAAADAPPKLKPPLDAEPNRPPEEAPPNPPPNEDPNGAAEEDPNTLPDEAAPNAGVELPEPRTKMRVS